MNSWIINNTQKWKNKKKKTTPTWLKKLTQQRFTKKIPTNFLKYRTKLRKIKI